MSGTGPRPDDTETLKYLAQSIQAFFTKIVTSVLNIGSGTIQTTNYDINEQSGFFGSNNDVVIAQNNTRDPDADASVTILPSGASKNAALHIYDDSTNTAGQDLELSVTSSPSLQANVLAKQFGASAGIPLIISSTRGAANPPALTIDPTGAGTVTLNSQSSLISTNLQTNSVSSIGSNSLAVNVPSTFTINLKVNSLDSVIAGGSTTVLASGGTPVLTAGSGSITLAQMLINTAVSDPSAAAGQFWLSSTNVDNLKYSNASTIFTITSTKSAVSSTTSAAPTATASATAVMMGLALAITPVNTGRIMFTISGQMANDTINDGVTVQLRTGTGSAPANGDAVTGTQRGASQTATALVAAERSGFAISVPVTGLTLGTALWVDAALNRVTGGNASITGVTISAVEF